MTSRQIPANSPSLAFRGSSTSLRLTAEEWELIVGALSAYQHNQTYRPLYEKFVAQAYRPLYEKFVPKTS